MPLPDHPAASERSEPTEAGTEEALAGMLDTLSRQPDFPSLADALASVRRVARSDSARVQQLAQVLRADIGLAHRVLRQANAAHYRSVGGGEVDSLERAITVLGFQTVGQLAVSARLVQQVRSRGLGLPLREGFLRALVAGAIGQALQQRADEDVALLAMVRNLGRLMVCLHWPQQAERIARAVSAQGWPLGETERQVTRQVFGVDQDRLGQAVAARWGWPASLRAAMRHTVAPARQATRSRTERLRATAWLANELADLLLYLPADRMASATELLWRRFGPASGLPLDALQSALARGRAQVDELCLQLELPLMPLPRWPLGLPLAAAPVPQPAALAAAPAAPASEPPAEAPADQGASGPDTAWLASAVHAVADRLASADRAAPVYHQVLQALLQGLGAQRAVLCLRRGRQGELAGTLGLARDVVPGHEHFLVPPQDGQDLFSLLCWRHADSVIADARDPVVARGLPHWWRQHLAAGTLLVLPLVHQGEPVGMLYCDAPQPGALDLDEGQWRLVRTLRNQALLAWRIAG